jgi:hypothetical protein
MRQLANSAARRRATPAKLFRTSTNLLIGIGFRDPPGRAAPPQANSDAQLIEIWLHGRPPHTQRAYAGDIARFC